MVSGTFVLYSALMMQMLVVMAVRGAGTLDSDSEPGLRRLSVGRLIASDGNDKIYRDRRAQTFDSGMGRYNSICSKQLISDGRGLQSLDEQVIADSRSYVGGAVFVGGNPNQQCWYQPKLYSAEEDTAGMKISTELLGGALLLYGEHLAQLGDSEGPYIQAEQAECAGISNDHYTLTALMDIQPGVQLAICVDLTNV